MRLLKLCSAALVLAAAGFTGYSQTVEQEISSMKEGFQNPPSSARPRVWWHWMNGNITKDGIKKDIDWMHRSGIAGFHHFDASMDTPIIVDDRLVYMTDEWKDAFQYAVSLAEDYGMEVAIASSPGWSHTGGPWVAPKDAMKKISWREMTIQGGKSLKFALPEPYKTVGAFQDMPDAAASGIEPYYEDIAVLAVKVPSDDMTMEQMEAKLSTSGGDFTLEQLTNGSISDGSVIRGDNSGAWLAYRFSKARTIRAVTISFTPPPADWTYVAPEICGTLESSDDGVRYKEVAKIPSPKAPISQQTVNVPETAAKYFRLRLDESLAGSTVSEFVLYTTEKVNHFEEKAAFAAPVGLSELPTEGRGKYPQLNDIVDLTNRIDADGNVSWIAPKGTWKIYRFGYSLTGHQNSPAPAEATGLEVDKFDPTAWTNYFQTYLDMYKEASGNRLGKGGFKYILTDSYEAEAQNWTERMAKEFQSRRGYSLLYWMPALAGQIVVSPEETDQFLFDFRTTISELFAENYSRINDIIEDYGLEGRYTESHENGRAYVTDGMDIKRTAAIPMSAAWIPDAGTQFRVTMNVADIRESASVAHIYGQNITAGESFTIVGLSGNAYSYHPANLKPIADSEMANGLNRFVIHESAHQPSDEKVPGLGLICVGQWFNRHETWAEQARVWMDYLSRSSFMLQQGRSVSDILVYYGEDTNITGQYGYSEIDFIPDGYNYDFVNPTALMHEVAARGGKMVTKSGQSYEVLYLDKNAKTMSLPVLRSIADLAEAGVLICGYVPEKPASKSDDPEIFYQLVNKIWGGSYKNVSGGKKIIAVLKENNIKRDVTFASSDEFRFVHRRTDNTEIYWINKPSDRTVSTSIGFRVHGKVPTLWDPVTGEVSPVSYQIQNDVTFVTLSLDPDDAKFIVFGEETSTGLTLPKVKESELMTVEGPWDIAFQEGRGAPKTATFANLKSFTESADSGIQYFSGSAVYTKKFNLEKKTDKVVIDLGDVRNIAEVTVNGKFIGTVWKAPFKLDVTDAVKEGENDIRINVVNSWVNRLIGDEQPETTERIAYTSWPMFYTKDSNLVPSGLLGPVRLLSVE